VDVGAHSVAPSAHATRAGAYGEVDVVDDGTHAAGGVAAAEWLAATLGGGYVNPIGGCIVIKFSISLSTVTQGSQVRVPVLVMLMMAFAQALKVVALAPVPRATCSQCTSMMLTSPLSFPCSWWQR